MTLYDLFEQNFDNPEEITKLLIELDNWIERLHNNGFCIYDFDLKKILLENDKITFNSFRKVLNNIMNYNNDPKINIFQLDKIGLLAYNSMPLDGNMNQQHFEFLQNNIEYFNKNNQIPKEIFEYYQEVFQNLHVDYMNNYLIEKEKEKNSNQNQNTFRKTLSTDVGRMYAKEDNAFINILFIPSLITFIYFVVLFMYTFIVK